MFFLIILKNLQIKIDVNFHITFQYYYFFLKITLFQIINDKNFIN
jgi:hypothetical protein